VVPGARLPGCRHRKTEGLRSRGTRRVASVIDWVTVPHPEELPTDDTELIAASLVEPARFAELFDRHYPAVLRYLRRRIGPDLADDFAAETFTLAFRRRRQYRAEHPGAAWLYGIAGNLVRQHARTEVRRLRAYARVVPDLVGPDAGDGVAERIDTAAARRRSNRP
jgi:DNA-directed RNA polymerase specialized sigma24 family protein